MTPAADGPGPGDIPAPRAALVALAAALDPREFATTLTTGPGATCLSVTSRQAQIGDDIWADHRAYYWSWGEWIAPLSDPATAARMISTVLRTLPQPARD
jgi:hypothetical protein